MRYLILLLCAAGLLRAELVPIPPQFLIPLPAKPIVVDGKLDEWGDQLAKTPYVIRDDPANPLNSVSSNSPENPLKGDADYCGHVALAWDATYLYVACQATDDHLVGVKPDSLGNQGPAGWFCDSLMMSIASYRQPMKTNSPYSPNPFLAIRYAVPAVNPRGALLDAPPGVLDARDLYWKLPQGSKWASAETPDGYTLEAAIPWQALNYRPGAGERLFIAFLAGDVDPGEALNQIGWAATTEKWGTATEMSNHPVFRLADGAGALGILTVSSDVISAADPWSLRVELDALAADAVLEKVRIRDAHGKVALERPLHLKVPKGMRVTELLDFPAGALKALGQYTIEEVATINGKTTIIARAP